MYVYVDIKRNIDACINNRHGPLPPITMQIIIRQKSYLRSLQSDSFQTWLKYLNTSQLILFLSSNYNVTLILLNRRICGLQSTPT